MGHSCRTLLWVTLVRSSCGALLWDTLVGHSCETLLWDTVAGHSCGTLLWDTLVGHSCRTLLWDTLVGQSCGTLLWDTVAGHSCGTLYMGHSGRTLFWVTLVGSSGEPLERHAALTPACFALPSGTAPRKRTFHQGRANPNGTATSRTSRRHTVCPHTRSSHASVSYEASSTRHASRLQDERFIRDFLHKSRVKSPKRAFRTRLPPKLTCQSLQNERFVRDFLHTRHAALPSSFNTTKTRSTF